MKSIQKIDIKDLYFIHKSIKFLNEIQTHNYNNQHYKILPTNLIKKNKELQQEIQYLKSIINNKNNS